MKDVVRFILDTRYDDLPERVVHDAVRGLMDTLGVGISATGTQLSKIIQGHAATMFAGTASEIWPAWQNCQCGRCSAGQWHDH